MTPLPLPDVAPNRDPGGPWATLIVAAKVGAMIFLGQAPGRIDVSGRRITPREGEVAHLREPTDERRANELED